MIHNVQNHILMLDATAIAYKRFLLSPELKLLMLKLCNDARGWPLTEMGLYPSAWAKLRHALFAQTPPVLACPNCLFNFVSVVMRINQGLSMVMRVNQGLVCWIWVKASFHQTFCCIHCRTESHHLGFDRIAQICCFLRKGRLVCICQDGF